MNLQYYISSIRAFYRKRIDIARVLVIKKTDFDMDQFCKVGRVFPVIWSEFHMGRYRDDRLVWLKTVFLTGILDKTCRLFYNTVLYKLYNITVI